MKIILIQIERIGRCTYGHCICRWNGNHIRICHETRLKKCNTLRKYHFGQGEILGFLFLLGGGGGIVTEKGEGK